MWVGLIYKGWVLAGAEIAHVKASWIDAARLCGPWLFLLFDFFFFFFWPKLSSQRQSSPVVASSRAAFASFLPGSNEKAAGIAAPLTSSSSQGPVLQLIRAGSWLIPTSTTHHLARSRLKQPCLQRLVNASISFP